MANPKDIATTGQIALLVEAINCEKDCGATKGHGMMMIRLSHQALEVLHRYREKSLLSD